MKCPTCPVADGSCVGECPGGAHFCALAARDDTGRRHVISRSQRPCPGQATPRAASPPAPAVYAESLDLAWPECEHRQEIHGRGCCGSFHMVCRAGKAQDPSGAVGLLECQRCVKEPSREP